MHELKDVFDQVQQGRVTHGAGPLKKFDTDNPKGEEAFLMTRFPDLREGVNKNYASRLPMLGCDILAGL